MQVTRLNQKTKRAIFTLQVFDHPEHVFQSSRCESELAASSTAEEANGHPPDTIAIAVHCVSLEGDAPRQVRPRLGQFKFYSNAQLVNSIQSHTTIGAFTRYSDGSYSLKAHKQKLFVDGLSYLLQVTNSCLSSTQHGRKCRN